MPSVLEAEKEILNQNISKTYKPIDVYKEIIEESIKLIAQNGGVKIGAKTLWLQYGIHNDEAKKISENSNIKYVVNHKL